MGDTCVMVVKVGMDYKLQIRYGPYVNFGRKQFELRGAIRNTITITFLTCGEREIIPGR